MNEMMQYTFDPQEGKTGKNVLALGTILILQI